MKVDPAARVIEWARQNVEEGGRRFACVIDTFYGEFAKPFAQRRLPMVESPHPDALDLCPRRAERNG
jgi:hypothetical protein